MKKKYHQAVGYRADVVFRPALTPMEAAVLPARERRPGSRGALCLVRQAFDWERAPEGPFDGLSDGRHRQKIWVRYT